MAKRVETCKECLKYKVCHRIDNEIAYNRKGRTLQQIESDLGSTCHMFLNKSNFVEVVRCKDCRYLELELPYAVCSKARLGIVSPDDYCSYGERESDNDN